MKDRKQIYHYSFLGLKRTRRLRPKRVARHLPRKSFDLAWARVCPNALEFFGLAPISAKRIGGKVAALQKQADLKAQPFACSLG